MLLMEVSKRQKIVEFPKISIKIKDFKTFFATPSPEKSFLRLCDKYFLKEFYRNIQKFAFQVLQECSSWASRNGAVQIFKMSKIFGFVENIKRVEVR